MAAYNKTFELTIDDIEMIETALQRHKKDLSLRRLQLLAAEAPSEEESAELARLDSQLVEAHDLLGRLHNQKIFYRPRPAVETPYVSG